MDAGQSEGPTRPGSTCCGAWQGVKLPRTTHGTKRTKDEDRTGGPGAGGAQRREKPGSGAGTAARGAASPGLGDGEQAGAGSLALTKPSRVARSCSHSSSSSSLYSGCVFSACPSLLSNSVLSLLLDEEGWGQNTARERASPGHGEAQTLDIHALASHFALVLFCVVKHVFTYFHTQ